ncbi:hypothetical protein DFQ30_007820 [Apophysomyces sp. BC1015]|nr:hypothetical protein DFQ30_007820 [Apophysomyces sp. BC1015]
MTLVKQIGWLDRNMESLLQQPPAETVRFVAHASSIKEDTTAPPLPKHTIVEPQKKEPIQPLVHLPPTVQPGPSPSLHTAHQLEEASHRRKNELHQLETRFPDSYRVTKSTANETVVSLTIVLNDPDFLSGNQSGISVRLKYHVPTLYPLVPCAIETDSKTTEKSVAMALEGAFATHVSSLGSTLFQNLNWLNRRWKSIMETPVPSSLPEVSLPRVHTAKAEKKNQPIFEEGDKKKGKVIIVNDPSWSAPPIVDQEAPLETFPEGQQALSSSVNEDTEQTTAGSSNETPSVNTTKRTGMEIRLVGAQLDRVSLFRCKSLNLLVKCARCKSTVDIENLMPDEPNTPKDRSRERWLTCSQCKAIVGAKFLGGKMHYTPSGLPGKTV